MIKKDRQNIFLIGPMGAGKSSVGKYLAQQLGLDFYDTDEEIEKSTGVDIGWIFDVEGESGFRRRETAIIHKLTSLSEIVLATGGGSILEEENQNLLQKNGLIIYLKVSLQYQNNRTINESRRPLLRVQNKDEVLQQLHVEREPIYERLANFTVLTDNRSVKAVAEDILGWLNN